MSIINEVADGGSETGRPEAPDTTALERLVDNVNSAVEALQNGADLVIEKSAQLANHEHVLADKDKYGHFKAGNGLVYNPATSAHDVDFQEGVTALVAPAVDDALEPFDIPSRATRKELEEGLAVKADKTELDAVRAQAGEAGTRADEAYDAAVAAKVTISNSTTSLTTTTVASSYAVSTAYNLARMAFDARLYPEGNGLVLDESTRRLAISPDILNLLVILEQKTSALPLPAPTWVTGTLPSSSTWSSIICSPTTGRFMIVSENNEKAAYSDDGINWTAVSLPLSNVTWSTIGIKNPRGFALLSSSQKIRMVQSDAAETTWSQSTANALFGPYKLLFKYDGDLFALNPGTAVCDYIFGQGVDSFSLPFAGAWSGVAVSPTTGEAVIVATSSGSAVRLYTSDVLSASSALPSSANWAAIACSAEGRFATVAASTTKAAYSDDGITWTAATLPSASAWCSIACSQASGRFITIANSGTAAAYSADGKTWAASTLPFSATWSNIACSPLTGRFVAIAKGTDKYVYSNL